MRMTGRNQHRNNVRMETKWLEDFVSLAETRSFSRSALLRHVTQPAFSRRIQALEAWAGADLVDRSTYPTRLTPAGDILHAQSIEMLQTLQSTRALLRGHTSARQDVVEFAVPHTLAFTFFPPWVSSLRGKLDPLKYRLTALNVHDTVLRLVEGHCDFLIIYPHQLQALQLEPERYEMLTLGQEMLAPYVKPAADGTPLHPETLVSARAGLDMTLDVCIYRERPSAKVMPNSQANALWDELSSQAASKPVGRLLARKK